MSPLFPLVQSDLDLNGPILSFTTQPVGTSCSVASGIATFIGIATATFPAAQTERETNTGTVSHQWYSGTSALTDGTTSGITITGSATTTLTLSGLPSPLPISGQVFVQAGYDPNDLSPNAINEPLNSNNATLTVFPTISIDTQPVNTNVVEDISTSFSIAASTSDGSNSDLSYQWYLDGSEISGATSSSLSITRPNPGLDKVYCEVSHPTAQPGTVKSTEVNLDVASARTFIQWELIGNGARQGKGQRDLAAAGPFTARARTGIGSRMIQMFSPEGDIDVKITLGGAEGGNRFSNRGGEGGISVFKLTMKQNFEYTVKLGIDQYLGGGPRGGTNGGGGLAVIYEKATVVAVCGGGGGAGAGGDGGDGGGCNQQGDKGGGNNGGNGGETYTYSVNGFTQAGNSSGSSYDNASSGSGKLSGCTIGGWWRTSQGKAPCEDVGTGIPFYNNNGGVLSDTTNTSTGGIIRGYKPGQGFRNNGGAGSGNGGGGGAGARGGQGSSNGGGGGASGYTSLILLPSSTLKNGNEVGGNADVAFISVEAYSANDDQEPFIPPKSTNLSTERTVNWNVSRTGPDRYELRFVKESGSGPNELRLAQETSKAMNSQISKGAVYILENAGSADAKTQPSGKRGVMFKVENNALSISNSLDDPFNNRLTVSPDQGTFTISPSNPFTLTDGNVRDSGLTIRWTANW